MEGWSPQNVSFCFLLTQGACGTGTLCFKVVPTHPPTNKQGTRLGGGRREDTVAHPANKDVVRQLKRVLLGGARRRALARALARLLLQGGAHGAPAAEQRAV